MLPYHQRWRNVGKSLKWKWVWCYDVNCRGKRWVMYLMQLLKSQWGSYLLNGVINAIYYLCLSKWRNEIREGDDADLLFICRSMALACKLHYYSLFLACNFSIISPQITPSFLCPHTFSFGEAVSHSEKHFSSSGELVKVCHQLFLRGFIPELCWNVCVSYASVRRFSFFFFYTLTIHLCIRFKLLLFYLFVCCFFFTTKTQN